MIYFIYIVLLVVLCYASIKDMKTMEVPDRTHVFIILLAIVKVAFCEYSFMGMVMGLLIGSLPFLIMTFIKPGSIGGADIKLMAAVGLILEFNICIAMIVGLLIASVINIKKKAKELVALVPYLSMGIIVAMLI